MTEVQSVFTRRIETPPGAPWDQRRIALLDGRHRAPLPPETAAMGLRRLEPWRPRRPGIFAAAYVRRDDLDPSGRVSVEMGGETLVFRISDPALVLPRARQVSAQPRPLADAMKVRSPAASAS